MSESKLIRNRISEKAKLQKAQRQMVKLLVLTSSIIFITLLLIWLINTTPQTEIPSIYFISSIIIVISSLTIYFIDKAILSDEIDKAIYLLALTITLGLIFLITQYVGWNQLIDLNQQFRNILLPFTVIHFAHTLIGMAFLILLFFRLKDYQIHSKASGISTNVFYFWHFLGIIWLSFIGVLA